MKALFSLNTAFKLTIIATAAASFCAAAQDSSTEKTKTTTLDEVTVTAAGYEQSVKDAPASISVISAEELQKKSYTDVSDALKDIPGVHIQGGGVEQSIMIRGMSADYTLFLVDGRPQQDNQAFGLNGQQAGTPINFLPPLDAIERIEVIRGPASSLYGSSAIGGVVNIITKKVVNKISGSITSEYVHPGSGNEVTNSGFQTSAALNIPVVKDVFSIGLTGSFHNKKESDFVGRSDSAASDPKFKRENLGIKASLKPNEQNTFTFGVAHVKQERTHTPGKSLAANATSRYSESTRNSFFATHEARLKGMLWESYVNYETSKNPSRVNATTGNGISFDTFNANTQAAFFLGKHTLTAGANFKNEKLKDGATNGLNLPGIVLSTDIVTMKRDTYALFLEDNWEINDDLALMLSGRYDYNKKYGGKLSPKIYAIYDINQNLALKGGITTGYKTPSLRNAATDFGSVSRGGVVIGNPNLKPETTRNFEIGLNYSNSQQGIASSLTAYTSRFKDKLLRTARICAANTVCQWNGITYPAHQYGYTTMENVDSAKLHGIEWTLDWNINNSLTYRHSYTLSKSKQTSGRNAGRPLSDTPTHMLNASLDWQATNKLSVWTALNFRGKTAGRTTLSTVAATNDFKYPSYTFIDLGAVYSINKDAKLKFGIYNIANKKVTPDDGYAYVLDGRRYNLAVTFQF